jgi:hypothetical protein
MSDRIDRSLGSGGLWIAVLAVIIVLGGAAGTYLWLRVSDPAADSPAPVQDSSAPMEGIQDSVAVTLFVPGGAILNPGVVTVKRQFDTQSQAHEALTAVLANFNAFQSSGLKELKVREFFIDRTGMAYVDLASPVQNSIKASAEEEMLALYAMVNTLTQNFEEIKLVCFLLEGREAQTLAGHIDLTRKFVRRADLIKQ